MHEFIGLFTLVPDTFPEGLSYQRPPAPRDLLHDMRIAARDLDDLKVIALLDFVIGGRNDHESSMDVVRKFGVLTAYLLLTALAARDLNLSVDECVAEALRGRS